jgi:Zn-dependent metalloprotease
VTAATSRLRRAPDVAHHHRCSIFCVVPPHIFDGIARHGDDELRARALDTLSRDHSLRTARIQNAQPALAAATAVDALASATPGQPKRTIYDVHNSESLPGEVVRAEGGPETSEVAANEAYDGLGATYKLYWDIFHRDSIDDAGLPLDGVVHYGDNYDNAFWDSHRMIFGDGDNQIFKRFTISIDVIGHELTHGVTEHTAALVYSQQSGALNESLSDVFGSLVKQYHAGQSTAQADWLIGAGLLAEGVNGQALRSMKEPGSAYDDPMFGGKDPQPGSMDAYVETLADNGGVHINSGIPNRAFYLVAEKLGGNAWEKPGSIWYSALRDPRLQPSARFQHFASATARAARRLYGAGGEEEGAVAESWREVGVELGQPPEKQ